MPLQGEKYKHKSIKDVVYRVQEVDNHRRKAYLVATNGQREGMWVTFSDLISNYERMK